MKNLMLMMLAVLPLQAISSDPSGDALVVFDLNVMSDGVQLAEPRVAARAEPGEKVMIMQGLDNGDAAQVEFRLESVSDASAVIHATYAYGPEDQPATLGETEFALEWGKPFELRFQRDAHSPVMRYSVTASRSDFEAFMKTMRGK